MVLTFRVRIQKTLILLNFDLLAWLCTNFVLVFSYSHLPASNASPCKFGEWTTPAAGLEDSNGHKEDEVGHRQQEEGHGDGEGEVVVV